MHFLVHSRDLALLVSRLNYFYTMANASHSSGPTTGPSGPSGANGTHAATVWQNTTSLLVRALTSLKYVLGGRLIRVEAHFC